LIKHLLRITEKHYSQYVGWIAPPGKRPKRTDNNPPSRSILKPGPAFCSTPACPTSQTGYPKGFFSAIFLRIYTTGHAPGAERRFLRTLKRAGAAGAKINGLPYNVSMYFSGILNASHQRCETSLRPLHAIVMSHPNGPLPCPLFGRQLCFKAQTLR
jgi:hypothetical protein